MSAKVHHVKAAKDYPEFGIKKGEMHYTWSLFRQRPRRSRTQPTRSQLESSDFKVQLYELIDAELPACTNSEGLEILAESVRDLAEETRSKVDDLPENFQQGEAGQRLEARADELEAWADEIDSAVEELGTLEEWSARKAEEDDHDDDDSEEESEAESGEDESTVESDEAGYVAAVAEKVDELGGSAPDPE